LVLQSGGAILFYSAKQLVVQWEMMERASEKSAQFSTLKLAVTVFEKGKISESELRYADKLYDFKTAVIVGDSVLLQGIHDEREEYIIQKIKELCGDDSARLPQKLPYKFIKLLKIVYLCPQNGRPSFALMTQKAIKTTFLPYSQTMILYALEILSPPPELLLPFPNFR
jgi:hypothetical protein